MANRYWVGGNGTWDASSTANWSATTGGASGASAPTSADAVFIDANSGTGIITTAAGSASAAITLNNTNIELKLGANHSASGGIAFTIGTLNLNNFTLTQSGTFSSSNSNARTLAFGTTGKISISQNNGTVWACATITNLVVTGTPTVDFTYTGAVGTRSIQHGFTAGGSAATSVSFNVLGGTDIISMGRHVRNFNFTGFSGTLTSQTITVYGNLTLSPTMTITAGNPGFAYLASFGESVITSNSVTGDVNTTFQLNASGSSVTFADALTFGTRTLTVQGGAYKFKNGATHTFSSSVSFTSSVSSPVSFSSTVDGSQYTLSSPSGSINSTYLTVKDSNATGGATWNAYVDFVNTDAGNNDGWNFGLSPPYASYEPPIIIRSFTQPRRF